jgi:acetyl esterase/lipase
MSSHPRDGGNALMETDYVIGANTVTPAFAAKWLNGIPAISPKVNPLYVPPEELHALNPQLILVGGGEFALQEAKDWASLCKRSGVKQQIVCEWGELHIYALGSSWIEPAVRQRTDASIIGWMKKCLVDAGK